MILFLFVMTNPPCNADNRMKSCLKGLFFNLTLDPVVIHIIERVLKDAAILSDCRHEVVRHIRATTVRFGVLSKVQVAASVANRIH